MTKAKERTMPGKKPPGDGAAREREASRSHSNRTLQLDTAAR